MPLLLPAMCVWAWDGYTLLWLICRRNSPSHTLGLVINVWLKHINIGDRWCVAESFVRGTYVMRPSDLFWTAGRTESQRSAELTPDCCACGSAKYQMTFEGKWSQQSHPKDYPTRMSINFFSISLSLSSLPVFHLSVVLWGTIIGHYMVFHYCTLYYTV